MPNNSKIYDLTDTWNDINQTFTGIKLSVSDINSKTDSDLMDLSVNGQSKFNIDKLGNITVNNVISTIPINGDLQNIYANAVFSSSYASVEAAHAAAVTAGKTYVIVNSAWSLTANFTATLKLIFAPGFTVSCGSYTLNLSNGFDASDTQQVFFAADSSLITLPKWQRLTPFHYGAKADYISVGSPGTDDGAALNAWASELCYRVMPAGKYGTTQTIHWNGNGSGTVTNQNTGMQCDPQAWIIQRTDNIPIMTVWGSRGVWQFPILEYSNRQASTNYGAVGLLIAPYPGQTGWYSNVINRVMVRGGANVGIFNPPAISSTVVTPVSAGATSIITAYAQTDALGNYPWVPGMWVQILLDNSTYHISRISTVTPNSYVTTLSSTATIDASSIVVNDATGFVQGQGIGIMLDTGSTFLTTISSVSGTTIGIADNLTAQASSGNAATASQTTLGLSTPIASLRSADRGATVQFTGASSPSTFPSAVFSNTIAFMFVDEPARYGLVDRGTGTGDAIANLYVRAAGTGDVTSPVYTIQTAVYISGKAAGSIAQMNVEHLGFNSDMIFVSSRHFKFGEVHIEGCRSYTNSTGIMAGSVADMDIDLMQVEYWTALATDIANAVGIFYPRSTPGTSLGSNRGQWRVKQLNTRKNIFERGFSANSKAFIAAYATGNVTQIKIDSWVYNRDGGIYPSGQLASPSNVGGLVSIGNLLPPDCVAYRLDADANDGATYQRIFTSPKGQFKIREIIAFHPSYSLTTANCGVFADNTGTTLISSSNSQPLATLTDTGKILSIPLASTESTTLRAAFSDIYFKLSATQSAQTAISATSRYLTGRSGGDNNTNLGFINFGSAHGLNLGDTVVVTDSVVTALTGKSYKVVDIPTTTQIVVYCDSSTAVGNTSYPITSGTITVQRKPTCHIMILGADIAAPNAY